MSQSSIQAKIRSNPKFAELVGKRTRFAIILSLIVIGGWLLTGVYVSRANGEFDRLNEEILKEARK